mmetsp:Transcript_9535/g.26717  ORF Transcript_9535/g.26717 Transcript_9535/m.26717 type:complete len:386 (+) Transcript_9535:127-1284(+)
MTAARELVLGVLAGPGGDAVEVKLHLGGNGEAKGLGHLEEVQIVDVVAVPKLVGHVGGEVGLVREAGGVVEVVVLLHETLQFGLDVDNLLGGEGVLVQVHLVQFQVVEELELRREQDHQGLTGRARAGGPAHAVNVLARVVRGVELNDPVHLGYVQPARRDVGAQQDPAVLGHELKERGRAALLLLLAVQVLHRHPNVVEQLGVELHRVARGEKDNHFLVLVAVQERDEQEEAAAALAHHVALLQGRDGGVILVLDLDHDRLLAKGDRRQLLYVLGHSGRKQHRLALRRQELQDLVHLLLEPDLKDAVRLVHHETLEVAVHKRPRVVQVVKQTPRCRHQNVHPLGQLVRLRPPVRPPDDQPVRLGVELHQLLHHPVRLERELARR